VPERSPCINGEEDAKKREQSQSNSGYNPVLRLEVKEI
jgi:hypothetical protein